MYYMPVLLIKECWDFVKLITQTKKWHYQLLHLGAYTNVVKTEVLNMKKIHFYKAIIQIKFC